MTDHRFWEADAAARPDAPQGRLEQILLLLREPEPPWATICALMHVVGEDGQPIYKAWQKALTALAKRASKAVQAARQAGGLAAEGSASAAMRAEGWEPFAELGARLVRQSQAGRWGQAKAEQGTGADGETLWRWTWPTTHADGRQAGQARRCVLLIHRENPAWARIRWASWSNGQIAKKADDLTAAQAMGVDADDLPAAGPGAESDEERREREAIEAEAEG